MSRIEFVSLENLLEMKANDDRFKLVEVLFEENTKMDTSQEPSIYHSKNWRRWLLNDSRRRIV